MKETVTPFRNEAYTFTQPIATKILEEPNGTTKPTLDSTFSSSNATSILKHRERYTPTCNCLCFCNLKNKKKHLRPRHQRRIQQQKLFKPKLSHPGIPILAQMSSLNSYQGLSVTLDSSGEYKLVANGNGTDKSLQINRLPQGYYLGFCDGKEVIETIELTVVGDIPKWVCGVFYRCGPGKFSIQTDFLQAERQQENYVQIAHWFDGLSLLHRFEFTENGKIFYRSRFTSDVSEKQMKKTGMLKISFAQPIKEGQAFWKKLLNMNLQRPKVFNMNIAVTPNYPIPEKEKWSLSSSRHKTQPGPKMVTTLLAKTDANILQELDPITLEPLGYRTYTTTNPLFKGIMSCAHELYDSETGEYINFIQEPGLLGVKTHVFAVTKDQPKGYFISTLHTPKASYMHSFAITKNYVILIMAPYFYKFHGLPVVFTHNVSSALKWEPKEKTQFYVLDRHEKKLAHVFKTDSFFVFHTINAFEHNEQIIVDVCAYSSPNNIQEMTMNRFRTGAAQFEQSYLRRYFLPLNRTHPTVQFEVMSVSSPELPNIHPLKIGRYYQYAYTVHVSSYLPFESLVKHDLENKQDLRWMIPKHYPSEPVFVPKCHSSQEDQGIILSIVLDAVHCQSYLLILDAVTMKERAKALLENIVPYGFHGIYDDLRARSEHKEKEKRKEYETISRRLKPDSASTAP